MSDEQAVRNKFWQLPLDQLNSREWELLCDSCGRCCLKKIQDEETDEVFWTRIACRYLDESNCRCKDYEKRTSLVPTCLNVQEMYLDNPDWMPDTCAYRLRAENKPLYDWHPLLAGSDEEIVAAGISMVGKTLNEDFVHPDGYQEHVIRWVKS